MHTYVLVVRCIALFALTATLFGCSPGMFYVGESLSTIIPTQTPIEDGSFRIVDTDGDVVMVIDLRHREDGTYNYIENAESDNPRTTIARVFGPFSGFYIFEAADADGEKAPFFLVPFVVERDGRLALVDPVVNAMMAEMLYERLGLALGTDERVFQLTDNSQINLALIQDLLSRHRDRVTFSVFAVPETISP